MGTYNKIWKGNLSDIWDNGLNWTNGSAAVAFTPGDAVQFDDLASVFNVTSSNPVEPSSVLFNNNVSNYVLSAAMAGTGVVFKTGSGTVTLSGNNTYSGQTTIAGGMLTIGGSGVLGNGNYAAPIINNGTLNYASAVAQTNSGVISGGGTLISSGSGTLTLAGANTYAGATTVSGGTLMIQRPAVGTLPVTSGLMRRYDAAAIAGLSDQQQIDNWPDSSGSGANATRQGGTPRYIVNGGNGMPVVSFATDGNTWFNFTAVTTIRTVFFVGRQNAPGDSQNFILGHNSTYHFHTGGAGQIWSGGNTHANIRGGVTRLDGVPIDGTTTFFNRNSMQVLSVRTTGNVEANQLTLDRNIGGRSWRGDIAEILIYDRALTDSEMLEMEAYLAKKWQGSMPPNGAVALSAAGAVLGLSGTNQTIGSLAGVEGSEVQLNGQRLVVGNNTANSTFSGVITDGSGAGGLTKDGFGTLTLAGSASNTYTGDTIVQGGFLALAKTGGAYAIGGDVIGVNALSPKVYTTADNQFAPGSVMVFRGLNGDHLRFELLGTTQTLGGIENGGMVDKGIIQHREQVSAALQVGTLSTLILDVAEGAEYLFAGYLRQQNDTLRLVKVGLGKQRLSGGNINYNGTTTVNGGELICTNGAYTGSAGSSVGVNSYITINNGTTLDNRLRGPLTVWGTIRAFDGAAQTIGGDITLNGGTLESGSAVGNNATYGTFYFNAARRLTANGAGNIITGSNNTLGLSNGGNLTFDTPLSTDALTVSGKIVNQSGHTTGAIAKNGAGTVTLSGANTYSGATTVNGGALLVNGSLANSAVTVNSNGTLGGNGTINGAVTLNAGGMLSPGAENAIGTLSLASTLALNGNPLLYDVSNVATDKVAVASALVVNGINTVVLSFPNGAIPAGDYTLMTFASRSGSGTFVLNPAYANCSLVTNATNVVLLVGAPTGFPGVTWTGNQSANWNLSAQNWTNSLGAMIYTDGNGVTFDDTASGNFTITNDMVGVAPGAIWFNNS
jgi:autotransporter-associated beta strand protein